jgi:MFS family permease
LLTGCRLACTDRAGVRRRPGARDGEGIYGAPIGVAVAVGPLVGGALTDSLGWESVFYLNVPVGVAAIVVTYLRLRESRDPHATRVDWAGVTTFSAALFLLVLALVRGNDEGRAAR